MGKKKVKKGRREGRRNRGRAGRKEVKERDIVEEE